MYSAACKQFLKEGSQVTINKGGIDYEGVIVKFDNNGHFGQHHVEMLMVIEDDDGNEVESVAVIPITGEEVISVPMEDYNETTSAAEFDGPHEPKTNQNFTGRKGAPKRSEARQKTLADGGGVSGKDDAGEGDDD